MLPSTWVSQSFKIPDDFRAFMREVAAKVDFGEIGTAVGENALEHECGRGGRIEHGSSTYRFTYLAKTVTVAGRSSCASSRFATSRAGSSMRSKRCSWPKARARNRGDALIVWGEYDEDALRIRSLTDLAIALDAMQACEHVSEPCSSGCGAPRDQQCVAALNGLDCALYVVASEEGYGRSVGDPTRNDTFAVVDHDVGTVDRFRGPT